MLIFLNKKLLYFLIFCGIFYTCADSEKNDSKNRRLKIPNHLCQVNDYTTDTNIENVIIYLMDADCGYCVSKLENLNNFITNDSCNNCSVQVYAHNSSNKYDDLLYILDIGPPFNFPIFIDSLNCFKTSNNLLDSDSYFFVIDGNNKVILLGDPFINSRLNKLYKDRIYEKR